MQNLKKVQACVDSLKSFLPQGFAPQAGIVLGTGLGSLAESMRVEASVPYNALPGFPLSTVQSHVGNFLAGTLGGVPIIMQQGRCHQYEGRTPDEICMGVRVMAQLGIGSCILTNAAGAVNPRYSAGDLMLIDDHINFTGKSPLTGPNEDAMGPRFPDMSRAYDPALAACLEKEALALGIRLEKGVYFCTPGPQLETPAETRAYRFLGADAVGMSTVLEVIALRHMGVKVLAISCLTNKNLPDCMAAHTLEEILATAETSAANLSRLLTRAIPKLAASG